jgi:hypothetical protein
MPVESVLSYIHLTQVKKGYVVVDDASTEHKGLLHRHFKASELTGAQRMIQALLKRQHRKTKGVVFTCG